MPDKHFRTIYIIRIFIAAALLLTISTSWALACTGVNYKTGKPQTVKQIFSSKKHTQNYIAEATSNSATGQPLIIYYHRYKRAPAYYKTFVRHHECCHHIMRRKGMNSGDETGANCCALRRMRVSKRLARKIKNYMISQNINSDAWSNYEGVGAEFWARTYARCPRAARVK